MLKKLLLFLILISFIASIQAANITDVPDPNMDGQQISGNTAAQIMQRLDQIENKSLSKEEFYAELGKTETKIDDKISIVAKDISEELLDAYPTLTIFIFASILFVGFVSNIVQTVFILKLLSKGKLIYTPKEEKAIPIIKAPTMKNKFDSEITAADFDSIYGEEFKDA